MAPTTRPGEGLLRSRSGNVGISAALVMPLVIMSMGLGIDYGYLTLQRREMQTVADLAAIVAAADIASAEEAVLDHFRSNGLAFAVSTPDGLMTVDGERLPWTAEAAAKGVATLERGRYVPDPAVEAGQRFIRNATPADAVQVTIEKKGNLYLAALFSKPPELGVVGTAAHSKFAAFSVGSRLASLNGGLLNAVLGQMLGTSISLKAMDYEALLDADIDIQPLLKLVATRLNLTAGSYEDVLTANLTMPQLIGSLRLLSGLGGTAASALKSIEVATAGDKRTITLANILNIDPKKSLRVDAGSDWTMRVSALQLVSAAAAVTNGEHQIAFDATAGLPGIASAKINLSIGEPPMETPSHRLAAPGAAVRTAQTRVAVRANIEGLAALSGVMLQVPLYVELAHAEAKLADIHCLGGSPENASVAVDAVPGVAEFALGEVNPDILASFSAEPRVASARIVDTALLKIDALAHITAENLQPSRLTFSPNEVASRTVKSVSTKDILSSTMQTLLGDLDTRIQVGPVSLGSPTLVREALAETLSAAAAPIDDLLYNLLLLTGVRVGEADIRVTGVSCQQPVLVQ
ncbi:hypothetical protein SJ05684_c17530 [Sinorhizobium sojae CCBAU 05684]|uniref:Uncharacterized protein n=1 Tax=Sinorhizobium sojae CCBAU 05684 TaxID=716928 RepID=A0A249PBQ1_9HYPH|nr:pilus assembly protein TadG-related protein [Sinorhizobium sojae]ASY63195.1 hypothetical protein SJ05684_c17530 [Sinorhizobium sojae CCBAU 05684]